MFRPAIRCRRPRSTSPARSVLFLNVNPIFARIARTSGERLVGQGLALGCTPPDGAEKLPPVSASLLEHGSQRFPAGCSGLRSRGWDRSRSSRLRSWCLWSSRVSSPRRELCRCMLGSDLPLILAANEPPAFIYRSVNTYPHLALATLGGGSDRATDAALAASARLVFVSTGMKSPRGQHGSRKVNLRDARRAISRRQPGPRPSAPWIRCSSNIHEIVPGTVDEVDGKVTFADASTTKHLPGS